ncbi:MAG: PLP-dependent transferase [Prevotella sp.]|nr:PLP-dependent transferase [Prevotella sp.]MBR4602868.1 PLP-dependent transferase [Prevotella sp.]MBR6138004.1 PLP-dependent transferase [Prevotella sp.]
MRKQTKAIHTTFAHHDAYGALSMPVYNSVAYEFDDAQTMSDTFRGLIVEPDYSRTMNPTVTHLENKVKEITGASNVTAFNSGMAAISNTLIALSGQGRTIITSRHLFGNTVALMNTTLKRFGVRTKRVDLTKPEEVADAMDDSVCCIFLEIMTNPQLEVAPLKILADIAHRHNVPLVADSTMIPFTEHQLHNLGVDIELVSSTKYVSGGATSLGGLVIDYSAPESFRQSISQEMLFNLGAYMTPHAAYMQTIGLETLHARYAVQSSNALLLAKKLKGIEQIKSVGYVGLPDNPYHEIAHEQFGKTAGAMLTIDLNDRERCFSFINNLKLIKRATNLFDNRTLAIHPASTIFGNFTDEERKEMDVRDTTIRISVGLEDVDDIYEDIIQALG